MAENHEDARNRPPAGKPGPAGVPLGIVGALAEEISSRIAGGRVRKVKSPSPHSLLLAISTGREKENLYVSCHRLFPRINLAGSAPSGMPSPSAACEALRPALMNRRVQGAAQIDSDRVIAVDFEARGPEHPGVSLVVEFIPRAPNLFLVQKGLVVFALNAALQSRGIGPGLPYTPPSHRRTPDPGREEPYPESGSPSELVERLLESSEAGAESESLAAKIRKTLTAKIRKAHVKAEKLAADFVRTGAAEELRRKGEIVKANLGNIEKGTTSVIFEDMYSPSGGTVEIGLDPSLTPRLNMDRYFAKYKKLKRGREKISALIGKAKASIASMEAALARVDSASSPAELREIAAGLGVADAGPAPQAPAARAVPAGLPKGVRHFVSADGLDIFVGKGGEENEKLTFSFGRGSDMWLHVSGVPGPHVIIRIRDEGIVPQETLLDAAALAVFFSRARGRVAEVLYSWRKNVARPRKGKPGLVYVADRRSMRIGLEEARLSRLLKKDF